MAFMPMVRHTMEQMASTLPSFLKERGSDITNRRGQSYRNASSKSGRYNGVQAIVMRACTDAAFIPCCSRDLHKDIRLLKAGVAVPGFVMHSIHSMLCCLIQHSVRSK